MKAGTDPESREKMQIIGPAKASVGRINDIYRFVIYCKHKDYNKLVECKDKVESFLNQTEIRGQNVQFDFDPIDSF